LEYRDHDRIHEHLTAGAIAPLPFRLSWREQLRNARRSFATADALGSVGCPQTKRIEIGKVRNIDRDEQVGAIVRQAEVAVERPTLRASCSLGQEATQESPKHLGPPEGNCIPALAPIGLVVGSPCSVTAHVGGIASLAFSAIRILPIAGPCG